MTFNKARKLVLVDTNTLKESELQKYKVSLIDAWRYARGDYGYQNDFFMYVGELKAYTPKDYWLLKNIESKMDLLGI
jgi:hypothetical protein